jgi:hypothetical protein
MPCTYASSDPEVARVDASGKLTALSTGATKITAVAECGLKAECLLIVFSSEPLRLPSALKTLEESSFEGSAARDVILPDGLLSIGKRAFANCSQLGMIAIPDSVATIAPDAFAGSDGVMVLCTEGSAAHSFALRNGIAFQLLAALP